MANGIWIIYNIYHVTPSLSYLQMQGVSNMSVPMDDFLTSGGITEVIYVIPCGVYFHVVKTLCCSY